MPEYALEETKQVSLCEALDRILNKGAVVRGEVTISVANIDLIYLGLKVIVASIETAREMIPPNSYNSPPLNVGVRGGVYANESCRTTQS